MTPVLPPPTADELSAIRARLDGRRRRLPARWPLAVGLVLVAVLVWRDIPDDLGTELVEWRRAWPVLTLVVTVELLLLLRTVVRLDDAVMRRLSSTRPEQPYRGRPALGSRAGAGLALAATGALLSLASTAWAASRGGPVVTWWAFAGLALAMACGGAALAVVALRPGIGTGQVLEAVDRAIRRDDLRNVVRVAGIAVLPGVFVLGPEFAGGPPVWAAVLSLPFLVALWLIDVDERLLLDHRLPDAEPPASWLARGATT